MLSLSACTCERDKGDGEYTDDFWRRNVMFIRMEMRLKGNPLHVSGMLPILVRK